LASAVRHRTQQKYVLGVHLGVHRIALGSVTVACTVCVKHFHAACLEQLAQADRWQLI